MLLRMAFATALVAGCEPGAPPVAPDSNPSSPQAAEGTVPALASASAPHLHAASYVCPMHPEVTSSEPGTCPKCHMTLVPAK